MQPNYFVLSVAKELIIFSMNNIIEYRLEQNELQLEKLKSHAEGVNASLITINEAIKVISKNLDSVVVDCIKQSERINLLEDDMKQRKMTFKTLKSILSHWPLIFAILLFVSSFDLNRLQAVVHYFK